MDMKSRDRTPLVTERKKSTSCLCSLIPATALLCIIYFIVSSYVAPENKEKLSVWGVADLLQSSNKCKNQCRPLGSETLPEGIVTNTSNMQMRPLWSSPKGKASTSLFAVAVGIKQKDLVHKMVEKFLSSGFVVMLFHYDGIVDEWKEFEWCDRVIHVSARNQTKWWFAKRFLHPSIVSEYSYIFLWDEDLGVEYFHPKKYVSIVEREGLEISQPALDPAKSEVHHQITARGGRKSTVHRRIFKHGVNRTSCNGLSKAPPCTGWIEMMAPVFARSAWRCVWYMIQNDLIHAWGLDIQLGYCAQGDRTKNIGVVDAEYIVHYNRPTLGGTVERNHSNVDGGNKTNLHPHGKDPRVEVRRQSYIELEIFKKRWEKAVKNDKCWVDPYQ